MTNLPITSNSPQSTAKGTPGDTSPLRTDPSVASDSTEHTSQTNSTANDQAAEPFCVLLERQIGEVISSALTTTQLSVAIDGNTATGDVDPTKKDAQNQTIIATNTTSDPANSLIVGLLQIPVQQTYVASKIPLLRGTPSANMEQSSGYNPAKGADGKSQRKDISLTQISDGLTRTNSALTTTVNSPQIDSSALTTLASDAFKHLGVAVNSADQPLVSQNNIKAVTSSLASAVTLTILNSNIPAEIPKTITTPLSNSGWADEFSQKIVWLSTQQNHIAELHLNPPDLGPLNVVLKISDNQLTAQFTSPHSAVRDAVENALPKLRDILSDNGITLGNATVGDQPPRDRNADGFMNQNFGTAARREASYNATKSDSLSPTNAQSVLTRRHNGMLDIFA